MALVEPGPPDAAWPRYSSRPFPAYRFVPGLHPHPRRDPKGHSFGVKEEAPPALPPERWRENQAYLYGVDLYNYAYWWECHEVLEALWHLTGREGTGAAFLQGLIQVAAANLRRHLGSSEGARRLAKEAVARLGSVGERSYMGLELEPFIRAVNDQHLDGASDRVPLISLQ
jgi:hypothetical protein